MKKNDFKTKAKRKTKKSNKMQSFGKEVSFFFSSFFFATRLSKQFPEFKKRKKNCGE